MIFFTFFACFYLAENRFLSESNANLVFFSSQKGKELNNWQIIKVRLTKRPHTFRCKYDILMHENVLF